MASEKNGKVREDGIIAWGAESLDKLGSIPRVDGWVNALTGLGNSMRDKRLGAQFSVTERVSFNKEGLNSLYAGDDLAANIVDIPAEEAIREWIDLMVQADESGELDTEVASDIMQELDALDAQQVVSDALVWARLFGGSIILLGVDDGQEVDQPLDLARVRSLDWLTALDRFDVEVHSFYEDPLADKFGEPEFYSITGTGDVHSGGAPVAFNTKVHESRTIRFDGVRTTRRRRRENRGWADSVFERHLDIVRDYQSSQHGIAHLLTTFSQAVFKIKDLAKALSADRDDLVLKRMTLLDMARSIVKAVPLDAEHEDYETKGAAVSGMADLVDRQMMRVASATRIPVTLLFGRSPAGMNATGDSDIRLFYDRIAAFQETQLRPRIEYLLTIMLSASEGPTSGAEPASWSFDFVPLYQESAKEKAETRKLIADADHIYVGDGVLSAEEVALSRFGGDDYSPETQLDKEQREEDKKEEERLAAERAALPQQLPPQVAVAPDGQAVMVPREPAEDAREDAPGFKLATEVERQAGELCKQCAFARGRLCDRFDFIYELGHRCDDFLHRREVLIQIDRKDRPRSKRRRRGRNS